MSELYSGKCLYNQSKQTVCRINSFRRKETVEKSFFISGIQKRERTAEAVFVFQDVSFLQASKVMKEPSNFMAPQKKNSITGYDDVVCWTVNSTTEEL